MKKRESGFTLIEIAIVLVIIGLLLGGVLKGQELITGARVRNLIQQQDGVKAAYFGFLDRYRALPGDYGAATTNISGTTADGNANGQIGGGTTAPVESILAWEHLAKSGFINGSYVYNGVTAPSDASNPKNPYAGFMQLIFDGVYGAGGAVSRHNLKTGANIPVEIVAELDRKVDDGAPYTGAFQFSTYAPTGGTAPTAADCVAANTTTPTLTTWNVSGGKSNCGGTSLY
ncbi:MAG TPA: prepilin-type N-terminal cleavage/methylation domain-containing protein [Burkholderiales bacterium]|nr:prepilin-type N-terminal cleavage/methylation domain-containing protein [Burkholderiales bacterium]